jgi:hypothetical protein
LQSALAIDCYLGIGKKPRLLLYPAREQETQVKGATFVKIQKVAPLT